MRVFGVQHQPGIQVDHVYRFGGDIKGLDKNRFLRAGLGLCRGRRLIGLLCQGAQRTGKDHESGQQSRQCFAVFHIDILSKKVLEYLKMSAPRRAKILI